MIYDIGVIGGGVIGLACAWRLAQNGARVVLFEKGEPAHEASWAAAGMLAAQSESVHHPPEAAAAETSCAQTAMLDLCLRSREMYIDFVAELQGITGHDVELNLKQAAPGDYRLPGILHVTDPDEPGLDDLAQQPGVQELNRHAIATQLGEEAPLGGEHFFWMPHEGQVESRKLGQALFAAARCAGVEIRSQTPVESLLLENGRAVGVETSTGRFLCEKILLAAGAWSGNIENLPSDCTPPVFPVAGEVLSLRPSHPPRLIIFTAGVYLVPRRDGRVLVGATMRRTGFEKQCTLEGTRHLLDAARKIYPALHTVEPDDQWCGLRPATPDGLPILGQTPLENLFVATGHYRNGILLTPITAKLITENMLSSHAIDAAFRPGRFEKVT